MKSEKADRRIRRLLKMSPEELDALYLESPLNNEEIVDRARAAAKHYKISFATLGIWLGKYPDYFSDVKRGNTSFKDREVILLNEMFQLVMVRRSGKPYDPKEPTD